MKSKEPKHTHSHAGISTIFYFMGGLCLLAALVTICQILFAKGAGLIYIAASGFTSAAIFFAIGVILDHVMATSAQVAWLVREMRNMQAGGNKRPEATPGYPATDALPPQPRSGWKERLTE